MEEPTTQAPMEEDTAPVEQATGGGTALVALGVIVVIILAGAFFIFGNKYAGAPKTEESLDIQFDAAETATQAQIDAINTVQDSTALTAIEADINASDLSDLDASLDAIDQEFAI